VLSLNETEPFNQNFNALGFQSMYFLNNMNSLMLGFLFYLSLVLLNLVIDRLQVRYNRLSNLSERLRHMLFYNLILSMLTESYSMIAVSCMIGLKNIKANSFGEFIQSASCIFAIFVLVVYPILIFWILKKSWNTVEFKDAQEKYEPIFENLRT
jgi:hypothetical protein